MNDSNRKFLILVIEDEKILADVLEERLQKEKFEVIKSYNGLEGLELALNKHPDLILLDLLMPKMNGLEVIKKLGEDTWGLSAKVIIFTNLSDSANVVLSTGIIGLGKNYEYMIKAESTLEDVVLKIEQKLGISK